MSHLLIGTFIVTTFILLFNLARRQKMCVRWWQWILTVLGFMYATFVLEMTVSFLSEGAPRAALVMGIITGFIAVIWGVILRRFVFVKKTRK